MTTECESWTALIYGVGWVALVWFLVNLVVTLTWYRPWNKIYTNLKRLILSSDGLVSIYMLESVFQLNFRDPELMMRTMLLNSEFHKGAPSLRDTLSDRGVKLQGNTRQEMYEELKVEYAQSKNSKAPPLRSPIVFNPALTRDLFIDTRSWWSRTFSRSS